MSVEAEGNARWSHSLRVLAAQSVIIFLVTMLPCVVAFSWLITFAGPPLHNPGAIYLHLELLKVLLYWMAGLSVFASLGWFYLRYHHVKRSAAGQLS